MSAKTSFSLPDVPSDRCRGRLPISASLSTLEAECLSPTAPPGQPRGRPPSLLTGLTLVFSLLTLFLLGGCASIQATSPDGFAAYPEGEVFRAVSPEGVVYRIRSEKHEPRAPLEFWREALKKRMLEAGYHFLAESDIEAGGTPAYLLELSAPLGTQDFEYMIAVFEKEDRLLLIESAGEVARFAERRAAILEAIRNFNY